MSSNRQVTTPTGGGAFVRLLVRFVQFSIPHWDKLLLRVLLEPVSAALWFFALAATAKSVDDGLVARDGNVFLLLGASVMFIHLFSLLAIYLKETMTYYVKMHADFSMKRAMFKHLQRMSIRFLDSRPVGENMYRVNSDTSAAWDLAVNTLPGFAERFLSLFTLAALLVALDPLMTLVMGVYTVIIALYMHIVMTYTSERQFTLRVMAQGVLAILQENLKLFPVSRIFSREGHEVNRYLERLSLLRRATVSFGVFQALLSNGLSFLNLSFMYLAYTLLCGYFVIIGRFTIGEFLALGTVIALVQQPIISSVSFVQNLRLAAIPARRMLETLDVAPEVCDAPDAVPLRQVRGEVSFQHVSFGYGTGRGDVIKDLSFRVMPGRKLAIVGAPGAGKSTVFNLLMRYYDPTGGRILVDGVDLRAVQIESYRERIGIVLQENFIYSASVRDNILFGNEEATPTELEEAVRHAGLDGLISGLSAGLDTPLKEGGDLSAGQKQRIAIARAIIRDPGFLFLDEATSLLDPATEQEVLEQLRQIEEGRTRIVVAHNIAAVQDADEILVLDDGILVQQGTHEHLIAVDGLYGRMWFAREGTH